MSKLEVIKSGQLVGLFCYFPVLLVNLGGFGIFPHQSFNYEIKHDPFGITQRNASIAQIAIGGEYMRRFHLTFKK